MSSTGYTSVAAAQAQGYQGPTAGVASQPTPGWQLRPGGAVRPGGGRYDARTQRQNPDYQRPTVDCNASLIRYKQALVFQTPRQDYVSLQPDLEYMRDMLPPAGMPNNPSNAYCTHHCHTAVNREKFPIYCAKWTPEGRRVITGAQSGEFTLWNGLHFNFETIAQGHEDANRAMTWSNDEQNMITGDDMGSIKYWNTEMANIERFDAHDAGIRAISTSPQDNKFASCGDDQKVKIWDYNTHTMEQTINQGADVKTVAWHPQKGLLVCGDKNYVITLLDPRSGSKMRTIYDHKGEVSVCEWNKHNGNWFISASRDQSIKLWDLRNLSEPIRTYQGQGAAVTSMAWHPVHQ